MACYKPLTASYATEFYIDDDGMHRERALLNHKGNPRIVIGKAFDDKDPLAYEFLKRKDHFLIPCGKCLGCRLDYSRHWADRMMLEYEACKKAVFVTLTYTDKELPNVSSVTGEVFNVKEDFNEDGAPIAPLSKKDMAEFIKCLRAKFRDNGREDIRVRFYGCGEYGEKLHRPHMHIILFGVSLEDLCIKFSGDIQGSLEDWITNELGQTSFRSNLLEDVWKERGIVTVSDVSYETMAYVSRYTLKKAQGDNYAERYGLDPEFTNMSRNPGIGLPFLNDHQEEVENLNSWFIRGKQIYWPKYILSKYKIDTDEGIKYHDRGDGDPFLEEKKKIRSDLALNKFLNKFENDARSYEEHQVFLENEKTDSVLSLRRGDVALS